MDPGSPPGHHTIMYGGSPPPSLGSSPPGGYYIMHHHPSGEYMPPPAHGYPMQHHEVGGDMATHMAGLSLGAQREGSVGSGSGRQGTGETRASARIARSHRAGGSYNPADFKFNVEEAEAGGDGARTTVMVRNIPNKYTQSVMLAMLDKAGFSDTYDFCYLPLDFRTRSGLGYMFVDFVSSKDAARLYKEFHGKRWDEFNSKKVCEVTYGRVQGRDALVEHFRSAKFPSEDPEFQPLVMKTTAAGKGKGELIPLQVYLTLATPCRGSEGNA